MFFSKTKLKVLKMVWDGRNKIKFEHLSKSRFRGQLVPSDPIMIMILNPVTQLPTHFFSICCVLHIPPQLVYLLSLFCFYIISRLTLARLSSSKSSKLSLFSFIRVGLFPPKFGTSVSGALIGQSLSVGSTGNERDWRHRQCDQTIQYTLGNFSKPVATIILPKLLIFLYNFL